MDKQTEEQSAPLIQTAAICTIRLNGQEMKHTVSSVQLDQYAHTHHVLKVRLLHVAQTASGRDISDPTPFAGFLGASVGLNIKPHGGMVDASRELEFVGVVTQVDVDNSIDGLNSVLITAHSPTIAMDGAQRNAFYYEQSASDIMGAIVQRYPITSGAMASTSGVMKFCVQYGETDYQFIRRLAGGNSLFAFYDGRKFAVAKAGSSTTDELVWRETLGAFSVGLGTGSYQFEGQSFDYIQKKIVSASSGASYPSVSGMLKKSPDASKQIYTNPGTSPLEPQVPDTRTLESLLLARKGDVLGRMIVCTGTSIVPALSVGHCAKIKGMGSAFDGTYWVNKVHHTIDDSGKYHNTFEGTPLDLAHPYNSPSLPPITHLQTGLVTDNDDPEGLGRVKVKLPWLPDNDTPFLRIAWPDAGNERGWFLMPEVDDEVLVGFEQGNPDSPVVIGCLYNGKDKPAVAGGSFLEGGKVKIKEFKTRNGNIVRFTDVDGDEQVEILQKDGKNSITMKVSGPSIMIESKDGDITIKGKNLTLDGDTIKLNTKQDIGLKSGTDLKIEAGANLTQKATANMEMQASAQVTVKGGIVQIN
ncbi:MAG: phage baseplate assembly protein V [Candidatus Zixiibacteriota bacterium]